MKKLLLFSFVMLTAVSICSSANMKLKDPIKTEVTTKYGSVDEALTAAKDALLKQKFIVNGEIGKTGFNAIRTTNAKADYYVADVAAAEVSGKVKLTITFVKVGTGLLKLQKVADTVKAELEK